MATYPLSPIPVVPASQRLLIKSNQSNQSSQFTGSQVVIQWYSAWTLELNLPRMTSGRAQVLAAWLDQLQGSLGTFVYYPVDANPGVTVSLSLTSTAYSGTNTIGVGGFGANTATGIQTGTFIQVGSQLVRVAAIPINADGNGQATIECYPGIRKQITAGTSVIANNPRGIFRLTQDSAGSGYQIDADWLPEFDKITAVEVIG